MKVAKSFLVLKYKTCLIVTKSILHISTNKTGWANCLIGDKKTCCGQVSGG